MTAEINSFTLIEQTKLLKKAYFQSPENYRDSSQFNKVLKIVQNLTLQDFKIPEQFPQKCTEGIVYLQPNLRMSLFFIPKGVKTLLHDHPNMYVINKVLKGSFMKSQYSLQNSQPQFKIPKDFINDCNPGQQFVFPKVVANKISQRINVGNIDIITPEDNLHSFETEQDSVFIDIIAPDYDNIQIFYNTYEQIENSPEGKVTLQMGPPKLQQNRRIKIEMN